MYRSEIEEGETYIGVFSGLFLFIALLSVITTMTRVIKKQRTQIGTLKALGYSNRRVTLHYVGYGFWISLFSSIAGLICGPLLIGNLFIGMEMSFFEVPNGHFSVAKESFIVAILVVIAVSIVTYFTCRKYLKENHGEISRLGLNYDITFLIVILTALYKVESKVTEERCIANPLKKKMRIVNEITEYAASMNILLSYYKLEDNLYDDNGIKDKLAYELYKGKLKKAYEKYPQKAEYIKQQLGNLRELEKQESKSIDKVSNIFGNLMGEIFVYKKDEYEQNLRNIGFNLGKYIYILDAYEDLEEDNKKGRYNPFIDYIDKKEELKNKVDRLISMSLGMATKNIEQLNLEFNKSIIDNIIYSGVYLRYKSILEKGCESNVQ